MENKKELFFMCICLYTPKHFNIYCENDQNKIPIKFFSFSLNGTGTTNEKKIISVSSKYKKFCLTRNAESYE